MVVGVVGSGKSTLLKALVGELPCDSGSISAQSQDSAYCSQTPWLQNASVRKIICGPTENAGIDEDWYKSVIHACALDQDILDLPEHHESLIGSRGVTLSGGQKQRLVTMDIPNREDIMSDIYRRLQGRCMLVEVWLFLTMFSAPLMPPQSIWLWNGYLETKVCSRSLELQWSWRHTQVSATIILL